MKTNKEAMMGLIVTLIRFGVVRKPQDLPLFMVWHKDVKRYSSVYGLTDEVERA